MSSYPTMLTPPSSSEDSPNPVYFVASPSSNSFQDPTRYNSPPNVPVYAVLPEPMIIDGSGFTQTARASLHIVEQPTDRFRFRYKSEMAGTHGSLTGYNSSKSKKQTYPTVELRNFTGQAIIRCSIYQLNEKGVDMKPHAHRLIMKRGKDEQDDPHDIVVGEADEWRAIFHGMGIIHTAKKNIVTELGKKKSQLLKEQIARTEGRYRQLTTKECDEIKGLAESESKSINLNIVCLRFDAFVKQNDILFPICEPVYSHGINNLKSALTGDLKIVRLDHVVCEAKGNKEIFILVERVTKKNIKIRFFETNDDGEEVWSAYGSFNDLDVHHQYAIVFRTPAYVDQNITQTVKVSIELIRPSDGARSDPRDFRYVPNRDKPGHKRARTYDYSSSSYNSSNVGSDEIPVVVKNINTDLYSNNLPSGLSEELQKALKDIDSEEFSKVLEGIGDTYKSLLDQLEVDAPKSLSRRTTEMIYQDVQKVQKIHPVIKMEVTQENQKMVQRVMDELKCFMKTNKCPKAAEQMMNHYLGEQKRTNAFHVAICQNDMESASFFFKTLLLCKRLDLLNIQNDESQTYLHLSVICHNLYWVRKLLLNKAKAAITDSELNTALHLAVRCRAPMDILCILLYNRSHEPVNEYINALNTDGYSAFMLAIETRNIHALKVLNMKKADVNMIHQKDGFVPLRLAIESGYIEGVKFLLSLPHIDATIKDFMGVSPLNAAIQKEPDGELLQIVQKYMREHHIQVEIKEEYESDDEMEVQEEFVEVKSEIPLRDLEALYDKVANFTPQCLDQVSAILDSSGKWEDLADLLDIRHIISSGLISDRNISKSLLTFAIETNNDSLWIIRNFLENLDELRAVELMDKMVQQLS